MAGIEHSTGMANRFIEQMKTYNIMILSCYSIGIEAHCSIIDEYQRQGFSLVLF